MFFPSFIASKFVYTVFAVVFFKTVNSSVYAARSSFNGVYGAEFESYSAPLFLPSFFFFFFPVFVLFCFCLLFCCFSITKMIAKVGHVISLSRAISHAIGRYRKRIKLVLLTSLSSLAQAFGKGPLKSNFSLFTSKLTNCL